MQIYCKIFTAKALHFDEVSFHILFLNFAFEFWIEWKINNKRNKKYYCIKL